MAMERCENHLAFLINNFIPEPMNSHGSALLLSSAVNGSVVVRKRRSTRRPIRLMNNCDFNIFEFRKCKINSFQCLNGSRADHLCDHIHHNNSLLHRLQMHVEE